MTAKRKPVEPTPIDERAELVAIKDELWTHLSSEMTHGQQKLGVGAIAGQLVKVVKAIAEIDAAAATEEEPTLEDALAAARDARAKRKSRTA